jgi:hypothetical protein
MNLLYPLALVALISLPLILLISKIIPPPPKKQTLPAFDFLKGLSAQKSVVNEAPLWLKILRICGVFLVVLGIASPFFSTQEINKNQAKNYLIVLEDGFSNANDFNAAKQQLTNFIKAEAARNGASSQFTLMRTSLGAAQDFSVKSDIVLLNELENINPDPVFNNYSGINQALLRFAAKASVICLCDNAYHDGQEEFIRRLKIIGNGQVMLVPPQRNLVIIKDIKENETGYYITLSSINNFLQTQIDFFDKNGDIVTSQNVTTSSFVQIPSFMRRKIFFARLKGQDNAAATRIINIFNSRPLIGLEKHSFDSPLLADATYIETAAKIKGEVFSDNLDKIIPKNPSAIVFADRGKFTDSEFDDLQKYIRNGGMIIRFSGPQLLASSETRLLPQIIRPEAKILSGNFTWNDKSIGTFDTNSPFYGLEFGNDAQISRLAVFEPGGEPAEIWAQMKDKSPLVSAKKIGNGYVVLVHTGLIGGWSNLGLTKYLYEVLERVLLRAQNIGLPATSLPPTQAMQPIATIDGNGKINKNPVGQKSVLPDEWQDLKADINHPPGIYSGGGSTLILNMIGDDFILKPYKFDSGFTQLPQSGAKQAFIRPILIAGGIILLLLEMVFAFLVRGRAFAKTAALTMLLLALPLMPDNSNAQTPKTDDIILGYIATPDAATNQKAKAGLEGLKTALNRRTNVEPAGVKAIDPEKDDLALYPVLYWLLPDKPQPLSPLAKQRLNLFMENGGMLFIDTRGGGRDATSARNITRIALGGLKIPPLEKVPAEHVVNKTFYLLRFYPARFGNANIWLEARTATDLTANDGVSPIIITDGDFASVWANGADASPLAAINGTDLQREISFRVGINIYLYALTGQYKNDQVHLPLLLERLRERGQ